MRSRESYWIGLIAMRNRSSFLFPSWKEYEAASLQEQRIMWKLFIRAWQANADEELLADIIWDNANEEMGR